MFYQWDTIEAFNAWHDALCNKLGYPIYPINSATGEIDLQAQPTTAYTAPYEVDGLFVAVVEDEYSKGLTPTDLRPTRPREQ
jgi:hypothetical protein